MMFRLQMVAVLFILLASLLATAAGKTSVRYEEETAWDQDWSDEVTGETTTACPWHSDWGTLRHKPYNKEVLYRLDVVPCIGIELPNPNQAVHYRASIILWPWYDYRQHRMYQHYRCIATKPFNSPGTMIHEGLSYTIRSPGYIDNNIYPSQQLSFYSVKCPDNMSIQIKVHEFRLQECVRVYGSTKACVDYVEIADFSKKREYCGSVDSIDELFGSKVLVTFRSSKYNDYKGFYITVRCTSTTQTSDSAEKSSGCLSVEGYASEHDTHMASKEKNMKIVPQKALKILMDFHQSFVQVMNEDSDGRAMSVHEAEKNKDILTLALLSERSCVPGYQEMGRKVLKLFPDYMVMEESSILEDEVSMYDK